MLDQTPRKKKDQKQLFRFRDTRFQPIVFPSRSVIHICGRACVKRVLPMLLNFSVAALSNHSSLFFVGFVPERRKKDCFATSRFRKKGWVCVVLKTINFGIKQKKGLHVFFLFFFHKDWK